MKVKNYPTPQSGNASVAHPSACPWWGPMWAQCYPMIHGRRVKCHRRRREKWKSALWCAIRAPPWVPRPADHKPYQCGQMRPWPRQKDAAHLQRTWQPHSPGGWHHNKKMYTDRATCLRQWKCRVNHTRTKSITMWKRRQLCTGSVWPRKANSGCPEMESQSTALLPSLPLRRWRLSSTKQTQFTRSLW